MHLIALLLAISGGVTDIRAVDFRNFTFTVAEERVRLSNGEFAAGGRGGWRVTLVDVSYGDVTGDGKDEAVVRLQYHVKEGNGLFSSAQLFGVRGGRVVELGRVRDGDRACSGITSAEIVDRRMVVIREANDCCAETCSGKQEEATFIWSGERLVRTAKRILTVPSPN